MTRAENPEILCRLSRPSEEDISMTGNVISRRVFLERCAVLGAAVGAGSLLAACSSNSGNGNAAPAEESTGDEAMAVDCTDTSGLSDTDIATREGLEYVDESTTADQDCANCEHFTAGAEGECGTCALVPGPINAVGWCLSWAEKVS